MGLERYLSRISTVMAPHLGDELSYHHADGKIDTTVTGFLKFVSSVEDQFDRQTKHQKIPVFRVKGITWPDEELVGDLITALDGDVWYVNAALTRPSGWTDLYVEDRGT
jgi:hypothetical protein